MPLARSVLERQLACAKRDRDAAAAKVSGDDKSLCPTWRNADAKYRQLVRRLRSLGSIEQRDQELAARTESSDE